MSVDWSLYWFEMWGLSAKRRERLLNGAHDMQQRPCRFSRDLEHAHQAVPDGLRYNDKAGVFGQARRNWFAHCEGAQEIRGQGEFGNSGKVPDARAGVSRPP